MKLFCIINLSFIYFYYETPEKLLTVLSAVFTSCIVIDHFTEIRASLYI